MRFFIATKNNNKLKELENILRPFGHEVLSFNDFNEDFPDVDETGSTFEENALLKAKAGLEFSGFPSIADDSGLCVDALDGAPGIFSARFASLDHNQHNNNALLLKKLEGIAEKDRTAKFVSVIACVFPNGDRFTVRGECFGKIGMCETGNNGFGYDSLFISEYGCFGELDSEIKNKISHRAKALEKFSIEVKKYININGE